jgi:carbamoyl-phosphate synthase large subunit
VSCGVSSPELQESSPGNAGSVSEINIPAAQSTAVSSIQAALDAAKVIGYPIILRSAFSLGGLGSGFAHDEEELRNLAAKSLSLSPQVLIEKSLKGWKEVEYEVVRDGADVGDRFVSVTTVPN